MGGGVGREWVECGAKGKRRRSRRKLRRQTHTQSKEQEGTDNHPLLARAVLVPIPRLPVERRCDRTAFAATA